MTIKQKIKKLGYKIRFVPHELIKNHIAFYNVKYKGKIIRPKIAEKLRVPLNEIWISERYKNKLNNILFHELREIEYRRLGLTPKQAHKKAKKDEEKLKKKDYF